MKRRAISTLLAAVFLLGLLTACGGEKPAANSEPPVESSKVTQSVSTTTPEPVPEPEAWYLEAAAAAAELGISTPEYTAESCHVDDLTVEEAIALCARIHAISQGVDPSFPSDSDYLDYALSCGILTANTFGDTARDITRRELAFLLAHTLSETELTPINTVVFSSIPGVTMADTYGPEIYTLYRAGVLTGDGESGAFSLTSSISHAETAVLAVRMLKADERVRFDLAEADPLPDDYPRSTQKGVSTFYYATTFIPEATGLPKLTNSEIDWLIATEDYRLIAESITTLADCVNYYLRARFSPAAGDYSYNWFTAISGQQVLARRGASCAGMSNATAYMLRGDYEELGYVRIDGHAMLYVCIDGLYYLLDPALYMLSEDPICGKLTFGSGQWGSGHENAEYCAADLQTIADSFAEHGYTTNTFITYVSPGDMFPHTGGPNGEYVYPIGTEINSWLGTTPVIYEEVVVLQISEGGHQTHVIPAIDWTTGEDWVDESLIVFAPFPPESTISLRWDRSNGPKTEIQDGETFTGAVGEYIFSILVNGGFQKHISATSSDESIVSCSRDAATGRIVLTAHAPGECDISVVLKTMNVLTLQIHWVTTP